MLNIIRKLKHVFTIIGKNIKKEQVEINNKTSISIFIYPCIIISILIYLLFFNIVVLINLDIFKKFIYYIPISHILTKKNQIFHVFTMMIFIMKFYFQDNITLYISGK